MLIFIHKFFECYTPCPSFITAFTRFHFDKIKTYDIDKLYAQKLQAGLANATVKVMHNILSKAFQKALKWGLIKKNPVVDTTPPSIKKNRKQIWSVEEAKTFLEVCEQEYLPYPILISHIHRHETWRDSSVTLENVDLNKGVIHVEESLARTKAEGLFVKELKTSHSERDVFLSSSLREALATYRLQQDENPMNLVFPSKNGTYLEPRNLLRKYKMLIKKAKVPDIPFHNLRHTHATILMRMDENPKVVSERLGHARVGIALDIY